MDIIRNNPYRTLGVLSSATRKDIERNKSQIKAFAKVGKAPSFPYDFENILGKVERTEESLNDAISKLSFDKDKVAYGLFWLCNASFVDEQVLNILKEKSIGATINYLRTCGKQDYSTYINLGCLCLANSNWGNAIYCYTRLFESSEIWEQYVASITDNPQSVSYDEELNRFVDNLIACFPAVNWLDVIHTASFTVINKDALCDIRLSTSSICKCLLPKYKSRITAALDSLLQEAAKVDRSNVSANLAMAAKMEQQCKGLLASLKSTMDDDNSVYCHYADKVALQTLNHCVYYFNNDQDNPACPKNILRYVRFCVKIAEGQLAKNRCKKNFDVIKEAYDNMCPQEIMEEVAFIEKQMKRTFTVSDIVNTNEFINSLRECHHDKLQKIKKAIGENDKYYWQLSERLVYFYFNCIINFGNDAMKAFDSAPNYAELEKLRTLFTKCKFILNELQSFPKKDLDCISYFNSNYQKFKELCIDYHVDEAAYDQTYYQPTYQRPSSSNSGSYNSSTKNSSSSNYSMSQVHSVNSSSSRRTTHPNNETQRKTEITTTAKFLMGIAVVWLIGLFILIVNIAPSTNQQKASTNDTQQNAYTSPEPNVEDSIYDGISKANSSETYDVTYYDTGDRPYIDYYGKGNYDRRTKNSLKIENGSESDAVVFLESVSGKKVRHVYIKKGEHFKMIQIPGGKYIIKVYQGNFWNAEKYNGDNAPYGGFMEDILMSKSDRSDTFDYPYPKSGHYYEYEVTLYKVANGNFQTESIREEEMFN